MAENKTVYRIDIQGNEELIRLRKELDTYQKSLKKLRDATKNSEEITESQAQEFSNLELSVKKTRSEFNKASKSIKGMNTTTKKGVGFIGKMAGAMAAANIATTAFTRVVSLLTNAVKEGFTTFKDFEFQMARVKAISGATDEEFRKLKNSAQILGRTTFFTASQVGELQLNLSKLGFNTEEILQSQEAILMLSTAMGEDLGRTATVVAASIRGFGEDTSQTGRFADAMASAFANSALDIEKFQTSMTKVSAIAATAGFSFEETTGLLALLTDRGIEASIAGTSLRNIFLKLQDPTSDLSQKLGRTVHSGEDLIVALRELDASGIDVAGVMQIVDNRQVQAMESFIRSADAIEHFNRILNDAAGSGQKMADVMEDTVGGAMLKLKSAYEGFILTISEGGGALQEFFENLAFGFNFYANQFASAQQRSSGIVAKANKDTKAILKDQEEALKQFSENEQKIYRRTQSQVMQTVLEGMEDRTAFFEDEVKRTEKRSMFLFFNKDSKDAKEARKNLEAHKLAVQDFSNMVIEQSKKEQDAEKEKIKLEKEKAKNAAKLSEQLKKLQERQQELVDVGDNLTEAGLKELTLTNQQIKAIQAQIKALQDLGVEKDKQKVIGDATALQELDMAIANERMSLQQQFADGEIKTKAELNQKLKQMEIDHLQFVLDHNMVHGDDLIKVQRRLAKAKADVIGEEEKTDIDRIAQMKETGKLLMEIGRAEGENSKIKEAGIKITQAAAVAEGIRGLINAQSSITKQGIGGDPFSAFARVAAMAAMMVSVIANIKGLLGGSGGVRGGERGEGSFSPTVSQFAEGGLTNGGMFKGASHANGGVKFRVGGRIHEAEGGEAIINKRSTAKFRPILSAINSYNGNGVKFAEGGLISSGEKFAMGGELRGVQELINGSNGGTQRVVLVESDVTATQNRVSNIESQATF